MWYIFVQLGPRRCRFKSNLNHATQPPSVSLTYLMGQESFSKMLWFLVHSNNDQANLLQKNTSKPAYKVYRVGREIFL